MSSSFGCTDGCTDDRCDEAIEEEEEERGDDVAVVFVLVGEKEDFVGISEDGSEKSKDTFDAFRCSG